MFACFSKKLPQKDIDLKKLNFEKIFLSINNYNLAFDANEPGFVLQNSLSDPYNQEEMELTAQLANKQEKINLFKKKIEELDKKLRFVEKIAKQGQEEYLIYGEIYSDSVKKFSNY